MKHRIALDSLSREFRLLRNRIEAEIHAPAVILVTSATERDGTGLAAYGLAESMSRAHQRAALVTTAAPSIAAQEWALPTQPALRRRASDRLEAGTAAMPGGLTVVAISQERLATISRSSVAEMVADLRAKHDYVVIDGGDLPNNSFALLLVASVDAVLVSFLAGRQETPSDRIMLDTLERSEAKMLGVTMTDQSTINHFAQHDSEHEPEPLPEPKRANPIRAGLEITLQRIGKAL